MQPQAIFFDLYGVLAAHGQPNVELLHYIQAQLKPRCQLGILSNAAGNVLPRYFTPAQLDLFDVTLLSHDVGLVKPQAAMYHLAAAQIGVPLERCVLVDDQARLVAGARAVGMRAVLYENVPQCRETLEELLSQPEA
ncbi:MAG TPA: HAD-IA family hydrolase [Candidatus Saccharimonadales bacterium]|nr:HAD-IA family hydrolase [Candidatus Saccharimonadales bacterium]